MKSIVTVNSVIPTVENHLGYFSGESLRDYDIAVFCPTWPYLSRIDFTGGGSCLSVESTVLLSKAMLHWNREIWAALKSGKTIFVILDEFVEDSGATGSTVAKSQRTYSTYAVNNYTAVPGPITLTNAKGWKFGAKNSAYKGLSDSIRDIAHYKVVITSKTSDEIFAAKDGSAVGAIMRFQDVPGALVLLPYFDFDADEFSEEVENGDEEWTEAALRVSNALVGQLISIDKLLRSSNILTPPPQWMSEIEMPASISALDKAIDNLATQIAELQNQRDAQIAAKAAASEFTHLLYENGKTLERAIEKTLASLGYKAETLHESGLEIDHVIVGPSGVRMIGESEGKDNSAIDITKFRQLESNIGEDFQRESTHEPAKGLLFGNGYRFTKPSERSEQFTQKCLTNAKRLGSALIRTSDLYPLAAYLLDHPDDETFKLACRNAIENTIGEIVEFPTPPLDSC